MRLNRAVPTLVLAAAAIVGCKSNKDNTAIESVGVDSLTAVRQELLDEVIASTTFMNDIHKQLEKARVLTIASTKPVDTPSQLGELNEQRKQVLSGITRLVARLDSVQTRLTYARGQVAQLTKKDSALLVQVAEYQKGMADLQAAA